MFWTMTAPTFFPMTHSSSNDDSTTFDLTPPQAPPTWGHNPEDVANLVKDVIDRDRAIRDEIGLLPPDNCTFESVRLP